MPELDELVKITLDKERHLRLTLKGMIEFQKLTGRNLLKGFDLKTFSLEDVAALTWASLIHEDKELEYESVLSMVDLSNIMVVQEAVTASIKQSLLKARKEQVSPLAKSRPRG